MKMMGLAVLAMLVSPAVWADALTMPLTQQKTADYYQRLISAKPQNLAALTLFTNLLPKGGDLHHHYSGSIYAETYLDWVDAQKFCIYINSVPNKKLYSIETKPQSLAATDQTNCVSAAAVRANNVWYAGVLQTWSDKDYANHVHDQPPPDQQFFNTFGYFGAVSSYQYNQGLKHLKARALAENVSYIETMLTGSPTLEPTDVVALLGTLTATQTDAQQLAIVQQAITLLANNNTFKNNIQDYLKVIDEAAQGLNDDHLSMRFQTYVSRNSSPAKVLSGLYSAFVATSQSPHLVAVNIVGPENGYVAMRDYHLHMLMFHALKAQFPKVNVAMHAGELVLGMVPPEGLKFHIREAVELAGAQRIGHGIDIAHEQDPIGLLKTMRERDVAVEINLTSNAFILGVKPDEHPIQLYQQYQVPYVISTDDSGVSRNNLSNEYLQYVQRYQPSYQALKDTVYRSIRYSFLSDADKQRETQKLQQRFAAFEQQMAAMP